MSTNQENLLRSFEEALQGRPEGIQEEMPNQTKIVTMDLDDLGPMTEEEVLEQALGEDRIEYLKEQKMDEKMDMALMDSKTIPWEEAKTILGLTPETQMGPATIPASTIDPPPVVTPYIPESPPQGQKEENSPKKRFEAFVRGPEFTVSWVEQHLQQFSNVPYILPSPSTWVGLDGLDVPKAVHDLMRSPSFLNRIWRQLEMVMGPSVDNTPWCVEVACSMMLFHFLWYLSE